MMSEVAFSFCEAVEQERNKWYCTRVSVDTN